MGIEKDYIKSSVQQLIMDYDQVIDKDPFYRMVDRIHEKINKYSNLQKKDFDKTCNQMLLQATKYRKVSVATFMNAFYDAVLKERL